jgi:hypothetical protein
MRKSALSIAAAVLVLSLPTMASAASHQRSFVGDALHQFVVPLESVTGTGKAAPAMKAKKAKKAKKKMAKKPSKKPAKKK